MAGGTKGSPPGIERPTLHRPASPGKHTADACSSSPSKFPSSISPPLPQPLETISGGLSLIECRQQADHFSRGTRQCAARPTEGSTIFPVIDTHQHLWDLTRFRLPWLKDRPALDRSYLLDDYLKATADLGCFPAGAAKEGAPGKIVKTIYMEVDLDPAQQAAEADYVLDVCRRGGTPMVAAVISGRPASADFKEYVTRYRDGTYIKGVRQVLHVPETPPGYCLDGNFIRGIRLLGEMGFSYDICLRPQELLDGAKLIDACPGTRFILDHCGNANVQDADQTQWKRDIAEVAKRKDVVCKVSGIVVSAKPGKWTADELAPFIHHVAEVFGRDRILFGGDWPVCTLTATYQRWIEALKSAVSDWNEQDQRKLFHDNAVRFYGLS